MHDEFEGETVVEIRKFLNYVTKHGITSKKQILRRLDEVRKSNLYLKSRLPKSLPENLFGKNDPGFSLKSVETMCLLFTLWILVGPDLKIEYFRLSEFKSLKLRIKSVQLALRRNFKISDIHNASVRPKIHYKAHVSEQIVDFGPPRGTWTMPWERNHSELNEFAINSNHKNDAKVVLEDFNLSMGLRLFFGDASAKWDEIKFQEKGYS
eukprot:gb/GECH01010146.1/.p1 GENE.gb/GECH01010146.1/~~gb/GECH01010146.1/.p1  ORF type:complete len:209 (+),score=3.19 gb/GECH01010146.1/:1-627(+)